MKRPFLLCIIFMAAGIVLGRYIGTTFIALFCFAIISTGAIFIYLLKKDKKTVLCLFFSIAGFLLTLNSVIVPEVKFSPLLSRDLEMRGVVSDMKITSSGNCKIYIDIERIAHDNITENVDFRIYAVVKNTAAMPGDIVTLEGKVERLETERNPGGYNEFIYERSRKTDFKISILDNITVVGKKNFSVSNKIFGLRQRLADIFDRAMPKKEAGLMKTLIIGDSSGMIYETRELYKEIGIYHILSVSGLHVMIFMTVFSEIIGRIFGKRVTIYIMIPLLLFYALLTGLGAATIRTVLMTSAFMLSKILERDSDSINLTALAGVALLLYEPLYLFDMGFQYSFIGVLALTAGTQPFERLIGKLSACKIPLVRKLLTNDFSKKYLSSTVAATIFTYPVTMFYSFYIPSFSIIGNLLVGPNVFLLVLSGFLMCVSGAFGAIIPAFFGILSTLLIRVYEFFALLLTSLPFSIIVTGKPQIYQIALFYSALGFFVYLAAGKVSPDEKKKRLKILSLSFGLFIVSIVIPSVIYRFSPDINATMLDVGQGDCMVISKAGTCIVVDGGGNGAKGIGGNTGDYVLVPYLRYMGITKIDAVFVSHIDADHVIGIIEALEKVKVRNLYLPYGTDENKSYYKMLIDNCKKKKVNVQYLKMNDSLSFGGMDVLTLNPDTVSSGEDNDHSLVLRLSYGNIDFLLTGDISEKIENDIAAKYENIESEILKVSHHGSKHSTGTVFLEEIRPKIALIGVSGNNNYGHPSLSVMQRLSDSQTDVFSTNVRGAITIITNGSILKIKTMIGN